MEPGGSHACLSLPLPSSGPPSLSFASLEQSLMVLWSNPAVQCSNCDQIIRYSSTSRGHCVLPYAHFSAVLWRHQPWSVAACQGLHKFVMGWDHHTQVGKGGHEAWVALSPAAVCQGHSSLFTCSVHSSTNPGGPAGFWAWTGWGRHSEGLCRCGKTFYCCQHTSVQRSPGFHLFSALWRPPSLWDFLHYGSVILIPLLFPTPMIAGRWGAARLNTSLGRSSLAGRLHKFSSAFLSVHELCWLRLDFFFFSRCSLILIFCITVGKFHHKDALCQSKTLWSTLAEWLKMFWWLIRRW